MGVMFIKLSFGALTKLYYFAINLNKWNKNKSKDLKFLSYISNSVVYVFVVANV